MKRTNHRFAEQDSFAGNPDSDNTQPVRAIQQTLFHLGDKHPSLTRAEDLAISIEMLQSEYPKYRKEILEALIVWYFP